MIKHILLIIMLTTCTISLAQNVSTHSQHFIVLKLMDDHGKPVEYASVKMLKRNSGTYSDSNGICRLPVQQGDSVLVLAMGFGKRIIPILELGKDTTEVIMDSDPFDLNEIVISIPKRKKFYTVRNYKRRNETFPILLSYGSSFLVKINVPSSCRHLDEVSFLLNEKSTTSRKDEYRLVVYNSIEHQPAQEIVLYENSNHPKIENHQLVFSNLNLSIPEGTLELLIGLERYKRENKPEYDKIEIYNNIFFKSKIVKTEQGFHRSLFNVDFNWHSGTETKPYSTKKNKQYIFHTVPCLSASFF